MRTKPILLLIILNSQFVIFNSVFAQTFERAYGGAHSETGTCIQHTSDGNYVIAGMSASFTNGNTDAYLLKVDPQGGLLWSKTYGGTGNESCYYVNTCTDHGFILTGLIDTTTTGNSDLFLIKTDSDGNIQWSTNVGGATADYGWYVIQTNDGGFLAAGATSSYGDGSYNGYLVKTNSAGVVQWTKVFGGSGSDYFNGMSKTRDGGFIITGATSTNSFGSSDLWLLKFDSNGDTLWTKQFGKPTEDAGNAVIQTTDGGYVVAGDSHTFVNLGAHRAVITKLDSLGNLKWSHQFGSYPGAEIAYDVLPDSINGYFLLCYTGVYGYGAKDVLLIRVDSSGKKMWAKTYGGTGDDDPWYAQQTSDGGLMIVGATTSYGAGQWDVFLVSTDSSGSSACYETKPEPFDTIPVFQIRSGTTIISGGVARSRNTITTIANTQITDPCLVSIKDIFKLEEEVIIYPNPSSGQFSVQVNGQLPIVNLHLAIFNVMGEEIYSSVINSPSSLVDLKVASGIYFYKLSSGDGKIATGKIVVE